MVDVVLDEHDRLAGIVLRQLSDCRTGSLADTSGRAHKSLKDHQSSGRLRDRVAGQVRRLGRGEARVAQRQQSE
jgi:hypothetical protein